MMVRMGRTRKPGMAAFYNATAENPNPLAVAGPFVDIVHPHRRRVRCRDVDVVRRERVAGQVREPGFGGAQDLHGHLTVVRGDR